MPIFEFSCNHCGYEFEEITASDKSGPCPHCGSSDTQKLMSCCARQRSDKDRTPVSSGGCGGCSGGNCASCRH